MKTKINSIFNNILIEPPLNSVFNYELFVIIAINQILLEQIQKYFIKVIFTQMKMKQALPRFKLMIFWSSNSYTQGDEKTQYQMSNEYEAENVWRM